MKDLRKWSKMLLPMSLITMTCAFAGEEIAGGCCPQPCCPTPCCVPQPKACIDCECYLPQFYDLQCAWGFFVTGDFLYWYARETNIDIGCDYLIINQPISSVDNFPPSAFQPLIQKTGFPTEHHYVKGNWNPAFRIGLGWYFGCDGWDAYTTYTSFHNHGKKSVTHNLSAATPAQANALLRNQDLLLTLDPWANVVSNFPRVALQEAGDGPFEPIIGTSLSGKWNLELNQVDLEFGRKTWISRTFVLRPYFGLRGAWTKTKFSVNTIRFQNFPLDVFGTGGVLRVNPYTNTHNNTFKNKFWGVGIKGGFQPELVFGNFCGCGDFSLYGEFGGALLWGEFKARNEEQFDRLLTFTLPTTPVPLFLRGAGSPTETDKFTRMQGILDLGIGLRWETTWCCDRYSTWIDLGWEHHYWFDFGQYHRADGTAQNKVTSNQQFSAGVVFNYTQGTDNLITNLGFGGLVVRLGIGF